MTTMLRVFALLVLCAIGIKANDCGSMAIGQRIEACSGSEPYNDNLEEMCNRSYQELGCMSDLFEDCAESSFIQGIRSQIDLNQLRTMLDAVCKGGTVPDFMQQGTK